MQRVSPSSIVKIWLSLSIMIGFIYFYYARYSLSQPESLFESTLSSSRHKVVEMNDRQPSFKLATQDGNKPYADGDRAQAKVVDSLKLKDKCRRDPSLVVVDVGAFLGNHHRCSTKAHRDKHSSRLFRRIRVVCCSMWVSSVSLRSATKHGYTDPNLHRTE